MPRRRGGHNKQDGRKGRNSIDLRKVDRDSKEYWEEMLRRAGLSLHAGEPAGRTLSYVGDVNELDLFVGLVNGSRASTPTRGGE